MTAEEHEPLQDKVSRATTVPAGLPPDSEVRSTQLSTGVTLALLVVPVTGHDGSADGIDFHADDSLAGIVRAWVADGAPACVVVPLYGCFVVHGAGRAGISGPPDRLSELEAAVTDFTTRESDLRDVEGRSLALLEHAEADAATHDAELPERRAALVTRYHEAVSLGRRLAILAPAVHAAPVHPPTLASQLGERLRERTRLAERHELASERVAFVERVADACRQRALELTVARQQTGLEWAIVVLLVAQTSLLVVDLLARQATQ